MESFCLTANFRVRRAISDILSKTAWLSDVYLLIHDEGPDGDLSNAMTRVAEQGDAGPSAGLVGVASHRGERKFVTVMFVDIVQSAQLIADADPEDADDRLLGVLQAMIDAVQRYGGTVNQVLGDGIMALFGVPRAQEDHALRACLAADAVHALTGPRPESGEPLGVVAVRVGLSSGEVVVRRAENNFDVKYRAVGEAVYLAQRLEEAATPGKTLLSRATLSLATEDVSVTPAGQVRLKPGSDPVEAFELAEVRVDHRGIKGLSRAVATSFIGRTGDLEAIQRLMDTVEGGTGQALAITGEAGIGKSRLVFEFLESVRDRWAATFACDLLPPGLARQHDPLALLVRRLLTTERKQSGEKLRVAVAELVQSLEIEGPYAHSAITEVLGLEPKDSAWLGLEPPERLQAIVEAVSEVVCATSCRQPQVLVFEDFQWVDTETRRFTEELAGRLSSARVLLIVTARSHHEKIWASWPSYEELDLRPLSRTQTSELLDVLLGTDSELDDVKHLLAQKAEGNPFFLEECVRALSEAGSLSGAPGDHRLAVPVAELEIPGSVQGVLAERMDALPASDRALLLRASVIGQRVDVGLLKELQKQSREDLLVRLERLRQAGFLERTRIMPNLEYSFRHALTHDVAYGTLLKRSRRYLHARVMAAIERRRIDQLPRKVELLAYHAFNSEDWPKAYVYCRRAGQHAQARSADLEAVEFYENSLQALSRFPGTRRNRVREINIRLDFIQSLLLLGQYETANIHLLSAQSLADDLGDKRRQARIMSMMALYHWLTGSLPQAIQVGSAALNLARTLNDLELEVPCLYRLGGCAAHRGDYRSACEFLEAAIARIPRNATHRRLGLLGVASAGCFGQWAQSLSELGNFSDARRIANESIRIADESRLAFSQVYSFLSAGYVLLRKGDFESSKPILNEGFALCRTMRLKSLFSPNAAALGLAYVRSGQVAHGLEYLEMASISTDRQALVLRPSQKMSMMAEAYLVAGRIGVARKLAWDSLRLAKSNGEKGHEAWAHWVLGEICIQHDVIAGNQAEVHLYQAHDIAVAHFMKPLVAHIEFGLGRWYCHRKSWDDAILKLKSAMSLYRELEMSSWLKLAETQNAAARREARVLLGAHQLP